MDTIPKILQLIGAITAFAGLVGDDILKKWDNYIRSQLGVSSSLCKRTLVAYLDQANLTAARLSELLKTQRAKLTLSK
ncbi:MAG TPA: hypothetical protein VLA72_15035, partial [Anaerolineales bacterium]|nr:hypothetical protein [Anaerolineales bacterium]